MSSESANGSDSGYIKSYEFEAYVDSLRSSSDRTRWVLYILIISVAVLTLATWNIRSRGWPSAHLKAWASYQALARENAENAFKKGMTAVPPVSLNKKYNEPGIHEEYVKEYVRRMLLVDLPLVGLAVDVNDIGTVGGSWLLIILLLMASAVAREHENLCLVLYKVTKILSVELKPDDEDSVANLLYHTLAMSQMLCHPPTLARHQRRSISINFLHLLVFLPAALQGWVIYTSWPKVAQYEKVADVHIRSQVALLIAMIVIAAYCVIYLQAMSDRWNRTFARVNPNRAAEKPLSWHKFVRLEQTLPSIHWFIDSKSRNANARP